MVSSAVQVGQHGRPRDGQNRLRKMSGRYHCYLTSRDVDQLHEHRQGRDEARNELW